MWSLLFEQIRDMIKVGTGNLTLSPVLLFLNMFPEMVDLII